MSEKLAGIEQAAPSLNAAPAVNKAETSANTVQAASTPERLEGIEEIDFLLEEIESKIAPLALA